MLSPALRFDASRFSLAGQGGWTLFESGNQVVQGSAAAAWQAIARGAWRLELAGSAGASQYADQSPTSHLLGGARVHVHRQTVGGWVGLTTGRTWDDGPDNQPVELSLAGWSVRDRLAVVGSFTWTRRGDEQYTDLLGAVRWTSPVLELEARLGVRPWTRTDGAVGDAITGGYGELTARAPLTRRLAASLTVGTYPSDPVRRVLGATHVTAGIVLQPFGRVRPTVPVHVTSVLRGRRIPASSSSARLEVSGMSVERTLRVHVAGAGSVELMGDFTDWTPVALTAVAPGVWEVRMPLGAGVYRVNLRVDGGPWMVPAGLRQEATEFGGAVGLLVVGR